MTWTPRVRPHQHIGCAKLISVESQHQIAAFNEFAQRTLWLDFELVSCSQISAVLTCGADLSFNPDAEIRFDGIFFASMLMSWKTDTSIGPVVQVVSGSEAVKLNQQYQVERGFHLFEFQPEGLSGEARCLIAAKEFSWWVITHS